MADLTASVAYSHRKAPHQTGYSRRAKTPKPAKVREFNACHLPAGNSDGGQFGSNADASCAGANPGSLHYGPARPSGKAAATRGTGKDEPSVSVSGVASNATGGTFTEKNNVSLLSVDDPTGQVQSALGMSPRALAHAFTKYLDQSMEVSIEGLGGLIRISMADKYGDTVITRSIKVNQATNKPYLAYHEYFRNLGPDGQGKGLMRAQMELYDHLGIRAIQTSANINTGAYAWARYGFGAMYPDEFRDMIGHRLDRYEPSKVNPGEPEMVAAAAAVAPYLSEARRIIGRASEAGQPWKVSDLRIEGSPEDLRPLVEAFTLRPGTGQGAAYVPGATHALNNMLSLYDNRPHEVKRWNATIQRDAAKGVFNLGRALLSGTSWDASMDLRGSAGRTRLKAYIGDWTTTPFVARERPA